MGDRSRIGQCHEIGKKQEGRINFPKRGNSDLGMVLTDPSALRAAGNRTYDESKEAVRFLNRSLDLWCARPTTPRSPTFLVIFASGDGGMRGGSKAIYEHMAEQGHYVATYSSRQALKPVKSSGEFMNFPEAAGKTRCCATWMRP